MNKNLDVILDAHAEIFVKLSSSALAVMSIRTFSPTTYRIPFFSLILIRQYMHTFLSYSFFQPKVWKLWILSCFLWNSTPWRIVAAHDWTMKFFPVFSSNSISTDSKQKKQNKICCFVWFQENLFFPSASEKIVNYGKPQIFELYCCIVVEI